MSFRPKRDPIIAVVHEILKTRRFTSRTDLRETVKERCAKLKLPYHTEPVEDAIEFVARQRRYDVPTGEPPRVPTATPPPPTSEPYSRSEAANLIERLQRKTGWHDSGPEPRVDLADRDPVAFAKRQLRRRFQADRVKAVKMVTQEVLESIARCEALESTLPPSEENKTHDADA
jgi:hypothetical protein